MVAKLLVPAASERRSPKYLLHQHLAGMETQRPHHRTHASDLMGRCEFCPREQALRTLLHRGSRREFVCASMRSTWDLGLAMENLVIGWFVKMGRAWGNWRCLSCGGLTLFTKRPEACEHCGFAHTRYVGIRADSPDTGISFGIDLVADMGGRGYEVVELKSMLSREWEKLKAPLAEHDWRTNLYLRLVEECRGLRLDFDRIRTDKGWVLYYDKGGYGKKDDAVRAYDFSDWGYSPFKEFRVTRDDERTQLRVNRAITAKRFKDEGVIPEGICEKALSKRAQECEVSVACFSGNWEAGTQAW